jgi:hypothetical protein
MKDTMAENPPPHSVEALVVAGDYAGFGPAWAWPSAERGSVPDMPDRIHLHLPLVTRDRKIRAAALETIW